MPTQMIEALKGRYSRHMTKKEKEIYCVMNIKKQALIDTWKIQRSPNNSTSSNDCVLSRVPRDIIMYILDLIESEDANVNKDIFVTYLV